MRAPLREPGWGWWGGGRVWRGTDEWSVEVWVGGVGGGCQPFPRWPPAPRPRTTSVPRAHTRPTTTIALHPPQAPGPNTRKWHPGGPQGGGPGGPEIGENERFLIIHKGVRNWSIRTVGVYHFCFPGGTPPHPAGTPPGPPGPLPGTPISDPHFGPHFGPSRRPPWRGAPPPRPPPAATRGPSPKRPDPGS